MASPQSFDLIDMPPIPLNSENVTHDFPTPAIAMQPRYNLPQHIIDEVFSKPDSLVSPFTWEYGAGFVDGPLDAHFDNLNARISIDTQSS
jgi:hypothetical protein